jgi:hypothetical protein
MKRRIAVALLQLSLVAVGVHAQQVPSNFTPTTPCRLFDSRTGPGQPLQVATTYQIAVRGQCSVPADANAVFLSVVATGATGPGNVTVWASDLLQPTATTMNFRGIGTDSSATFSRLCAPPYAECGGVDLSIKAGVTPTHVILDVVGYTQPLEPVQPN